MLWKLLVMCKKWACLVANLSSLPASTPGEGWDPEDTAILPEGPTEQSTVHGGLRYISHSFSGLAVTVGLLIWWANGCIIIRGERPGPWGNEGVVRYCIWWSLFNGKKQNAIAVWNTGHVITLRWAWPDQQNTACCTTRAVQRVSLLFQYLASCVEAMTGLSSEAVISERKDDFAAEVTVWHQFRALVRLL